MCITFENSPSPWNLSDFRVDGVAIKPIAYQVGALGA